MAADMARFLPYAEGSVSRDESLRPAFDGFRLCIKHGSGMEAATAGKPHGINPLRWVSDTHPKTSTIFQQDRTAKTLYIVLVLGHNLDGEASIMAGWLVFDSMIPWGLRANGADKFSARAEGAASD